MDEYTKFLADRLLSEEQPITYRLLSRALDIHVNTAKEMLYDYHTRQNAQKAGSIHATYLVYGIKTANDDNAENEDVDMGNSQSEPEQPVCTETLSIVREENLKNVLAAYKKVTSIHIYSLAPQQQRDLALLPGLSASLSEYSSEDFAKAALKYGTISNPQTRRRERRTKTTPAPAAAAVKPQPQVKPEAVAKAAQSLVKPQVKSESVAKPSKAPAKTQQTSKEKDTAPGPAPAKVKQELPEHPKKTASSSTSGASKPVPAKGGLAAAFAKAAAKPKPTPKPKKEEKEEAKAALSDDGEADDDDNDNIVSSKTKKKDPAQVARDAEELKRVRKAREEDLRKMMEEDDEDEDEDEEEEEEEEEKTDDKDADEQMEDLQPEPAEEVKKQDQGPAEVVSSTSNGRRRGKRRVMKKERILDDKGYMVTIQKPGWESFSEDEAPPPAKKVAMELSSSTAKTAKPAPKGQGNIMSFFSKK